MESLIFEASDKTGDNTLLKVVESRTGQDARDCYQCGKCTAGCPLAPSMDLMPNQVLRAIQLGQDELVLNSRTIWLCVACQACGTRCPCLLDIPQMMDALRGISIERGVKPALTPVSKFHKLFLKSIELTGLVYEVGLIGGHNLYTLNPFNSVELGLPMLTHGKLELMPRSIKGTGEIKAIFRRAREVAEEEAAREKEL